MHMGTSIFAFVTNKIKFSEIRPNTSLLNNCILVQNIIGMNFIEPVKHHRIDHKSKNIFIYYID